MNKSILTLSISLAFTLTLTACATPADHIARQQFANDNADKQTAFVTAAAAARKPVCEIKGVAGKEITLGGVSSFSCYASETAPVFHDAVMPQSEIAQVAHEFKDGVLGLAPFALGAKAISAFTSLGGSIERAGTSGYSHIQAPGAITTTNISNANQANTTQSAGNGSVIGSGSISTPTTVTSTVSTTTNTPTTTTTTTTDNHSACTTGTC